MATCRDLFVILPSRIEISLLDARRFASSLRTIVSLRNLSQQAVLDQIFKDWERWAAEVLESHLSYPALSFFRSQHNNQSWLGALITFWMPVRW